MPATMTTTTTTSSTPAFHARHCRSPVQMQMQFLLAPVSPLDKCMSRKRQRSARDNSRSSEEDAAAAAAHTKRARSALAHEISGLKASVQKMEHQVAHASASIQELRSLIGLLAAQRQRTAATTCAA